MVTLAQLHGDLIEGQTPSLDLVTLGSFGSVARQIQAFAKSQEYFNSFAKTMVSEVLDSKRYAIGLDSWVPRVFDLASARVLNGLSNVIYEDSMRSLSTTFASFAVELDGMLSLTANRMSWIVGQMLAGGLASASSVPWTAIRRRARIQWWMAEPGSDDDPATVELVEVDGIEYGSKWSAYWVSYLGQRVEDASADDARVITVGGVTMIPWGIRVNREDCDAFIEARQHPWGNGRPDLRNLDPLRPAANQRVLKGLTLLGFRRRRGRYSLAELWDAETFHAAYREAAANSPRRRGKRPRQVDIAGMMDISERQLRRLLNLYGVPDEWPSYLRPARTGPRSVC